MKDGREGKVGLQPKALKPLLPYEQQKLMLHLDWDDTNPVLQNEVTLSTDAEEAEQEDVQMQWQG